MVKMNADVPRYLTPYVARDLKKKLVLIAGPRQSGKTTLAKSLSLQLDYFNYDDLEDRTNLIEKKWDRNKQLIVLDELHKMPRWKSWLKGVYDKEGNDPAIVVTGSARLNALRKAGDSLAGRHFYYRLHPLDLKEVVQAKLSLSDEESLRRLMTVGGYPEPFLNGDENEYVRWRQGHLDIILRQDLLDLESVRDIRSIELLVQILRSKVGSPISANSLGTDLNKDPKTVQRWLELLEDLFIVFRVTPYSKDISRAVKKEPKFYFYDTGLVRGSSSQKLENLVACALLKESHFLSDAKGLVCHLHFLKIKGGREIDFVLVPEEPSRRATLVEVKWGDADASPNFRLFAAAFNHPRKVQLVQELKRDHTTAQGVEVRKASSWLSHFRMDADAP